MFDLIMQIGLPARKVVGEQEWLLLHRVTGEKVDGVGYRTWYLASKYGAEAPAAVVLIAVDDAAEDTP